MSKGTGARKIVSSRNFNAEEATEAGQTLHTKKTERKRRRRRSGSRLDNGTCHNTTPLGERSNAARRLAACKNCKQGRQTACRRLPRPGTRPTSASARDCDRSGHDTPEASAANRVRKIQTRERKVAMVQRPQQQLQAGEERQGDIDFNKGCGFITPVKLAKTRDPRRQRLFFHITGWTGTPRLQASEHTLPLRVRSTSVPNQRDWGLQFRAVKVSASGPSTSAHPRGQRPSRTRYHRTSSGLRPGEPDNECWCVPTMPANDRW